MFDIKEYKGKFVSRNLILNIPENNTDNEQKLVKLIASKEAILLVGAGSSITMGYPSWAELMKRLEEEIQDDEDIIDFETERKNESYLQYASRLKEKLGSRYATVMVELFTEKKQPNCEDCHVQLLQMPFRGIVTTNYDMVLEHAYQQAANEMIIPLNIDEETSPAEINTFFQSLNHGYRGTKKIAHIHGLYTHVKSLVLCEEDYEIKYGKINDEKWTLHKRILWALMATRRIVYIGFSMTDPFIVLLHKIVSEDFGLFNAENHFIISRYSTDKEEEANEQLRFAKSIKTKYGIQTVLFPDTEKHDGLQTYITRLNQLVLAEKQIGAESIPKTVTQTPINSEVINPEYIESLKEKSLQRNKKTRDDDN